MAMNTNVVTLTGNMTRDPELRFTPAGQATCNFGLAVSRRWQNRQSQEWEEATSFFDVTAWGNLAENAAQSFTKGARVLVTGRLEQRTWEAPEGGRRSKIEVIADDIAASVKYATAVITKVERSGGAPAPSGPDDYGHRQPAAAGAAPAAADSQQYYDEEPF